MASSEFHLIKIRVKTKSKIGSIVTKENHYPVTINYT
jgi:hypothetical protein